MGYRKLLQTYIRHVEICTGDNFIETRLEEPPLSKRDLGELRSVSAEITREAWQGRRLSPNYNARLRVSMNRHALTVEDTASLLGVDDDTVRRWRAGPKSGRHLEMSEAQFREFEDSLGRWLERQNT